MIAVIIIAMLSMAVAFALTTVEGGIQTVKVDEDRSNAFQFANAGIDHALYRLDQQGADLPLDPEVPYVPTVAGGRVVSFVDSVTYNGHRYDITATADPPNQQRRWKVRAIGTDNGGRKRLAVASIEATPLFTDGFFTLNEFELEGNQNNPTAYRSSLCETADPAVAPCDPAGILPIPIAGSLGTNSVIQATPIGLEAAMDHWQAFNFYGALTQPEAALRCLKDSGAAYAPCAPFARDQPSRKVIETPPIPAAGNVEACPIDPISGEVKFTGTIAPGDYTCADVVFSGVTIIGNNLDGSEGTVRIWPTNSLVFEPSSVTNRRQETPRLQIYFELPHDPEEAVPLGPTSFICDAEIWAVLYTPSLGIGSPDVEADGPCGGQNQPEIFGTVVAHQYHGPGNQFNFVWDVDSQNELHNHKYVVVHWRECPPETADTC